MMKTVTIAASVLGVSAGMAMAQGTVSGYDTSQGVVRGAAPVRSIGSDPNAQDSVYGTQSSSMLSQTIKNQSAAGYPRSTYTPRAQAVYGTMPQVSDRAPNVAESQSVYTAQAQYQTKVVEPGLIVDPPGPDNLNRVAIIDEYGYRYNIEGERIGRGR